MMGIGVEGIVVVGVGLFLDHLPHPSHDLDCDLNPNLPQGHVRRISLGCGWDWSWGWGGIGAGEVVLWWDSENKMGKMVQKAGQKYQLFTAIEGYRFGADGCDFEYNEWCWWAIVIGW